MPKLWNATIEAHRHEVREAILETAATLVSEHGLLAVTMSRIAEQTGIGRATLYKYFPDVEAILTAWHERQITGHLDHLAAVRDRADDPGHRVTAVLGAYAVLRHEMSHERHHTELGALLHRDEHMAGAHHQLHNLIRNVLADGVAAGEIRDDIAPDELAAYCVHALSAAGELPSKAAVRRLVAVTRAGVAPLS